MPILFRDIESRSTLSLADVGAWRYAADPGTEVLCVGYAIDDAPVRIWTPDLPIPEEFSRAAHDPEWLIVAHNDAFESALEERLLGPRYGWPRIPLERHRCTMAAALANALPGALDTAAAALGLSVRKNADGHRLMMQMARPRRPRKGEDPGNVYWHDDRKRRLRLQEYCRRDVEVERELYRRLPPLSPAEQELWQLDAVINRRGFHVDLELAEATRRITGEEQEAIDTEIAERTDGKITSINQVAKLLALLQERGHAITTLAKRSVAAVLAQQPAADVQRILELRQQGAQAAARKLDSLIAGIDADQRLRGTLRFHGASTGRWSGARFQPQNLKKAQTKDLDAAVLAIRAGDLDRLREIGAPLAIAGDVSRSMIRAAPGHVLIGADFSAIESRVLAWIAGEEWKLNTYRQFDDTGDPALEPYCVIASRILKRTVTPEDEAGRQIGKTADLSFGYGGSLGAWRRFDSSSAYTDAQIKRFNAEWRAQHAATVRFWEKLESGLRRALRTGRRSTRGNLAFETNDGNLYLTLPSGRRLAYPQAQLVPGKFEGTKQIIFKDNGKGWSECRGWFGTFTENVVQAIARDLLAAAMQRLEAAGYPIVLHVHDEAVAEAPEGFGSTDEFLRLMTAVPTWAARLPIAAKPWTRTCYAKPQPAAAQTVEPILEKQEAKVVTPTEVRLAMRANDYDPVAANGKIPVQPKWQTKIHVSREEIIQLGAQFPRAHNTGANCERAPALDVDIPEPAAAEAVHKAIEEWFDGRGVTTFRVGQSPKFLVPFQTDAPFTKMLREFRAPSGATPRLEFLGKGQQFIAAGIHPETEEEYVWSNGHCLENTPRADLPKITEKEAGELLDFLSNLLVKQHSFSPLKTNGADHDAADERVKSVDYSALLLSAESGADINAAQSRRILFLLNRGEHPDEVERIVLNETLASKAWDTLSWAEKKEIALIRGRIRSGLKKLKGEYDRASGEVPPWLHGDFHAEWCRISIAGGWPALIRPGHHCQVIDTKPKAADGETPRAVPLTLSEWLARKFPPRDQLMGAWLTTTCRVLLSADTGLGKSSLTLAILICIAAGHDFLHWSCRRAARVLFIDGEMSGEWLQVMAQDAARRLGLKPDNLCLLSRDDYPGMPPLNTKAGYVWLRSYIETRGPFDFIAFDNVMSLTVGNPKDPEAWQAMLDLIAHLTRARVGQLWINHTGHDASRSYGDKAKEWRMTSVLHLDTVERPDTDVSFELTFKKKRESTPLNRAEFQTVRIALINDRWVCNATEERRTSPKENTPADNILRLLNELTAGNEAVETPDGWRAVPTPLWRDACIDRGYCAGANRKTQENVFYRVRTQLANTHNIKCEGELNWQL